MAKGYFTIRMNDEQRAKLHEIAEASRWSDALTAQVLIWEAIQHRGSEAPLDEAKRQKPAEES